jgi:hypothetical protein
MISLHGVVLIKHKGNFTFQQQQQQQQQHVATTEEPLSVVAWHLIG